MTMESLLQIPSVLIFFAFLLLLSYLYPWRSRDSKLNSSNKRVLPPEAAGAWPIIGHLPLLGGDSVPHITLGSLADKYGPAFMIRLGLQPALVISGWELAKECFTTNDRVLATRSKALATKVMGYNYALFGFSLYGSYWREIRKVVMLEILSNRRLEMVKHVRASEVEAFIREIYNMWEEKKQGGQNVGVLVDMKKWFADLTLNIIVRMVAGKRYFGKAKNKASDTEEAEMCQRGVREFFHYMGLFVVSDAFPFLEGMNLQGYEKAMKKTAKNLDSILEGWLKEHQQKRSSPDYANDKSADEDFMDVMISIMEESKLLSSGDYDPNTVIKATCLNMILGGNDTTVVTFTWALSLLLNNPHDLRRVQDELDMHVGKERKVDESDIVKLEYLQAIVKETLRLYPAVPLSASHEAMEECIIAGFRVPKGTRIVTNLYKIHRDPRVWLEPSEYRPERFLTSHRDVDLRGQHFEFIPFGSGRRMCPGVSFALQVLHLGLARLLHSFNFATPSKAAVDMTESPGLTNLKATPLEVLLSPRLPLEVYGQTLAIE